MIVRVCFMICDDWSTCCAMKLSILHLRLMLLARVPHRVAIVMSYVFFASFLLFRFLWCAVWNAPRTPCLEASRSSCVVMARSVPIVLYDLGPPLFVVYGCFQLCGFFLCNLHIFFHFEGILRIFSIFLEFRGIRHFGGNVTEFLLFCEVLRVMNSESCDEQFYYILCTTNFRLPFERYSYRTQPPLDWQQKCRYAICA